MTVAQQPPASMHLYLLSTMPRAKADAPTEKV